MNKFPFKKTDNIKSFTIDYHNYYCQAMKELNFNILTKIIKEIEKNIKNSKKILVCGNGGSAAISNHFICDYSKYMATGTNLNPNMISLSSNVEMITAIGNDFGYEKIFSYQVERFAQKGDILIVISSSGNSENILNAIKSAKKKKIKSISLTGFGGGKAHRLSDLGIKFPQKNYGVIEDLHHKVMHLICQFIKQKYLKNNLNSVSF